VTQHERPVSTYTVVWLALIVLTALTVTVSSLRLGYIAIACAIVIAAVKSGLVLMVFMNLRREDRVFKVMLGLTLLTLTIILLLTFADTALR
jgi:cytochrome c oxidase subunit IV